MIRIKRAYEPPDPDDGARFLVDRLWPRGLKREELKLDGWLRDVAPSAELRRWFAHDPAKWAEFQRCYLAELDGKPESWQPLLAASRAGPVTLLYGARETERNNAAALKIYLESRGEAFTLQNARD
ncbi:MAG TPA: DUF488 domain-containing protein [Candidatus Fraserbacteria bacterium]|nr:DUF488 domain-containing protein [Candidatus Fraserbacteria bacterium]